MAKTTEQISLVWPFLFFMLYISDSPTAVTNYGIYKLCDKNVKRSKEFVRVLISLKGAKSVTDNMCALLKLLTRRIRDKL